MSIDHFQRLISIMIGCDNDPVHITRSFNWLYFRKSNQDCRCHTFIDKLARSIFATPILVCNLLSFFHPCHPGCIVQSETDKATCAQESWKSGCQKSFTAIVIFQIRCPVRFDNHKCFGDKFNLDQAIFFSDRSWSTQC